MLEVDLQGVYNLLILPRQLRSPNKGLYRPADSADILIRKRDHHYHNTPRPKHEDIDVDFERFLDYTKAISDHFGVDVVWQPYEYQPETASLISKIFCHYGHGGVELYTDRRTTSFPLGSQFLWRQSINPKDSRRTTSSSSMPLCLRQCDSHSTGS